MTLEQVDQLTWIHADLEVHLRKGVEIATTLEMFRKSGQVYSITGRGSDRKSFEYTFDSFLKEVEREPAFAVKADSRFAVIKFMSGKSVSFFKAQEILCREDVDLVVIGCASYFRDGISAFTLVEQCKAEGGISILGHPFKQPNNLRTVTWRSPRVKILEQIARGVDCVATFNQQLVPFFGRANRRAEEFARGLNVAGIAVSDSHLYRKVPPQQLAGTGITFRRDLFQRPQGGERALSALRYIIRERRFRNSLGGRCAFEDILALSWEDRKMLYAH